MVPRAKKRKEEKLTWSLRHRKSIKSVEFVIFFIFIIICLPWHGSCPYKSWREKRFSSQADTVKKNLSQLSWKINSDQKKETNLVREEMEESERWAETNQKNKRKQFIHFRHYVSTSLKLLYMLITWIPQGTGSRSRRSFEVFLFFRLRCSYGRDQVNWNPLGLCKFFILSNPENINGLIILLAACGIYIAYTNWQIQIQS